MQGAIVMLLALSGLGCQNKGCNVSPTAQTMGYASARAVANGCPSPVGPSVGPAWNVSHDSGDDSSGYSCRDVLRSTLWSFVIGRDPDVRSAREIEASVYSGGSGRY
jgi:hypothetical protein